MSTEHIMQTGIELLIVAMLLYGFLHEDKVISFEQNIKRVFKGNFKRLKRKLRKAKANEKNYQ